MNCYDLMMLKAKLLCYGIRANANTKMHMKEVNHYVFDKGFMHAAHFMIDEIVVNTCVAEQFCQNSPFEIRTSGECLKLFENDKSIASIEVLKLPNWCDEYVEGYRIGDYIRPHSPNCVACWPYLKCNYYTQGQQCKFCSMGNYHIKTILPEHIVVQMIRKALEYNPQYEIALSGGTCDAPDRSISYFSNICREAKKYNAEYISVETAPPSDLRFIDELKNSGATAIIMNLEIADNELRKKMCPGKSTISQNHYMKAYKRAVKVFGTGNVSCVLIAGIQRKEDIANKARELIELGVIPTIIPFKPLDGCMLANYPATKHSELIEIAGQVDKMLRKKGLFADEQKGCTKCNGCSLETIISQI